MNVNLFVFPSVLSICFIHIEAMLGNAYKFKLSYILSDGLFYHYLSLVLVALSILTSILSINITAHALFWLMFAPLLTCQIYII